MIKKTILLFLTVLFFYSQLAEGKVNVEVRGAVVDYYTKKLIPGAVVSIGDLSTEPLIDGDYLFKFMARGGETFLDVSSVLTSDADRQFYTAFTKSYLMVRVVKEGYKSFDNAVNVGFLGQFFGAEPVQIILDPIYMVPESDASGLTSFAPFRLYTSESRAEFTKYPAFLATTNCFLEPVEISDLLAKYGDDINIRVIFNSSFERVYPAGFEMSLYASINYPGDVISFENKGSGVFEKTINTKKWPLGGATLYIVVQVGRHEGVKAMLNRNQIEFTIYIYKDERSLMNELDVNESELSSDPELRKQQLYASAVKKRLVVPPKIGKAWVQARNMGGNVFRLLPFYEANYDELIMKTDEEILGCTKNIELNPNNVYSYFMRGDAFFNRGFYEKAIEDYTKAIELSPNEPSIYMQRGRTYYTKELYEKAIADFTKAIELDPTGKCGSEKTGAAYLLRGIAFHMKGLYDKAIDDYTKGINLNTETALFYYYRGQAYKEVGEQIEAEKDREKYEQLK